MATTFYIESRRRVNFPISNSNQFIINFPIQVEKKKEARLTSITFPNTINNIRTGVNDTIDLNETIGGAFSIILPQGAYNQNTFISILKAQLDANSAGGHTYTVTFDQVSNKFTITNPTSTFTMLFASGTSTNPSFEMGFNTTDTVLSNSATGSFPIRITNYTDKFYIRLDCCAKEKIIAGATGINTTYSFSINNDVASGDIYFWEREYATEKVINVNNTPFSTLQISLVDVNGDLLNFGSGDWSCEIEFI